MLRNLTDAEKDAEIERLSAGWKAASDGSDVVQAKLRAAVAEVELAQVTEERDRAKELLRGLLYDPTRRGGDHWTARPKRVDAARAFLAGETPT